MAEYFDVGCSRLWSWSKRRCAAALLAAVQSSDRGFDAVVVGEYEHAFYGDQFRAVMTFLAKEGVELWLPEAGGPVDLGDPGLSTGAGRGLPGVGRSSAAGSCGGGIQWHARQPLQ
ncbi:hypothetical protein AB0L13_29730 [Saccharopolyspora shandongensis]|uniref:hypothetical protein n=1 Tax=Saccharopolyspora shandongensis TaxID=418495 RepID=UPI0034311381